MASPCETCGFELWIPVTTLAVTDVGLYDDHRFPGRCMVSLREHHVHLDEVPPPLMASFWRDVTSVGAAPWRHPEPPSPLPEDQREHLTAAIRRALEE